jgi:hypothetical protein
LKTILKNPFLLFLLLFTGSSCGLLDDEPSYKFDYEPGEDVLITVSDRNEGHFLATLDVKRGRVGVNENMEFAGALSYPLGRKTLVDFGQERCIYFDDNTREIVVQEFDGKVEGRVSLTANPDLSNHFITHLTFGDDRETVYAAISPGGIVKLDLKQGFYVEVVTADLLLEGAQLQDLLYHPGSNSLVYKGTKSGPNDEVEHYAFQFSLSEGTLKSMVQVDPVFGLRAHPVSGRIYGLTWPGSDKGFRLVELMTGDQLSLREISSGDLSIDDLSADINVISSLNDEYFIVGGFFSVENDSENVLHRIDLSTGEHKGSVDIRSGGLTVINIQAE